MFEQPLKSASTLFSQFLQQEDLPVPDSIEWNPIPFSGEWGFGTASCFKVAAADSGSGAADPVPVRAQQIAQAFVQSTTVPDGFSRMQAERGYINLYLNPADYAQTVVTTVAEQGADFGRGQLQADKVMVEYAQPNTHHSFHIGHARNAILGESLARIMEFAGFETVRASYPGDVGLGVMKCVWAYDRFYKGQEPEGVHARGQWLAQIYAEANRLLDPENGDNPEQPQYAEEVRQLYKRWDEGDPEVVELWRRTRQWSLDELEAILKLLGVKMDVYFLESEVDKPAKQIVEELVDRGLAEDERNSGGPVIVRIDDKLGLDKETYRTAVLLRNDGTTLYLAKDLALARQKFEQYAVERSVYVVDYRQSLHLQQAFKILELWGFPQAAKCYHLAHGFVSLPEGAMSSRQGNVVLFMDVLEETESRVRDIIDQKNPDLDGETRETVAHQIALGALAYAMLSVDNHRDIVFSWERALDFDGQAAPYLQYAHVRANSILRQAPGHSSPSQFNYDLEPAEVALLERISQFPNEVQRAAEDYKPLILANYAFDLAREFTDFYQACPVLKAESSVRSARLQLTAAARQTLENSLRLLVIDAPEAM